MARSSSTALAAAFGGEPPVHGLDLPAGRLVYGDEGENEHPALWVSDGPAPNGLWTTLRDRHAQSGLWPLLLDHLRGAPERPWDDGELWPSAQSDPGAFDAETLLARWWSDHTSHDEQDNLSAEARFAVTAPYGQAWPGLSAPLPVRDDPGRHAARYAAEMLAAMPGLRLGLVAVDSPADAVTAAGWDGPANYTGTAEVSAVLRSWQERFGAYVIGVGFAELHVSVAAAPANIDEALRVAAEHFAFCPDNIWQSRTKDVAAYARYLIDVPVWTFWWD